MIKLKSSREAELMRRAGRIAAAALALGGEMAKVGVTTKEIDTCVHDFIRAQGAVPTFYNYHGFPGSICASVNDQVIHGIPGQRALCDGDIISIDVGATKDGYIGDCAATFVVGKASAEAERLIEVTRSSFFEGLKYAREGFRISDISHAIQSYVEKNGFSVVREYVGHGVGSAMHEPPEIPNFGRPGHGARLVRGMTLAIEPMVNVGTAAIRVLPDKWTVVTLDGKLSAHYENSILVTDGTPEILTTAGDL
ncbi:type I methionyl aminopeptidase [Oscillospiraceae bacterium CM]|nr:type I methionyl aminopeptidase [Oscillospiraceae bacterium CM]